MLKALLTLLFLAIAFGEGSAIVCYYRPGNTTDTNGTLQQTCSATGAFCYSYSPLGSVASFAGCSTGGSCPPSCVFCTTDYCNTVTPSAISCYTRNSTSSGDGLSTVCTTGVSSCFTQFSFNGYAGCGNCTSSASLNYGCRECTTSLCNTQTPSTISCYSRSASTGLFNDGTVVACPTGASSCASYSSGEGGCGPCTSASTSSSGCLSCGTNNCNIRQRKCYTSAGYSSSNYYTMRSADTCALGTTSCYKYTSTSGSTTSYYSGCGACPSASGSDCSACTSDLCNSLDVTNTNRNAAATSGSGIKLTAAGVAMLAALYML